MKYFLLSFLSLVLFAACEKDNDSCLHTQQGDLITLNDGVQARLSLIEDARCPCFANCIWEGYIGLTLTIGNDTILRTSDAFGTPQDSIFLNQDLYFTSRGDLIRLVNIGEPEGSCDGEVAGEDFCLELVVE